MKSLTGDSTVNRRLAWLFFPPSYLVAYGAALFPYFVFDAPTYPTPYVFGYVVTWAFIASSYPLCMAIACLAIGHAPTARCAAGLGALSGVLGVAIVAAYTGDGNPARFDLETAIHIPSVIAAAGVLLAYYAYAIRARRKRPSN